MKRKQVDVEMERRAEECSDAMEAGALSVRSPRELREVAKLLGLWDAIRADPGGNFAGYVRVCVRRRVLDELKIERREMIPLPAGLARALKEGRSA